MNNGNIRDRNRKAEREREREREREMGKIEMGEGKIETNGKREINGGR